MWFSTSPMRRQSISNPFIPPSVPLRLQDAVDEIGHNHILIVIVMMLILKGLVLHIVRFCSAWCGPYPVQPTANTPTVEGEPAPVPPNLTLSGGERQPPNALGQMSSEGRRCLIGDQMATVRV